jgi:general L-amino acid transport system substrate-binding protein
MTYKPLVFEKADEINAAYEAGRCDVNTTDQSGLYAQRLRFKNPEDHIVLPEILSIEPSLPRRRG